MLEKLNNITNNTKCLECSGRGWAFYWDTVYRPDVLGIYHNFLIQVERICDSCKGKGVKYSGK